MFDGTATLCGYWIVCRNGTHLGSFHCCHQNESQVSDDKRQKSKTWLTSGIYNFKVNGTHLAADSNSFLEKRRRGLIRFTNALVRHPVLSQEQLVVMFLTVPTVSDLRTDPQTIVSVLC